MKKTRRRTIYEVKNVSTGEVYETNISEIMDDFSISRNTVYYWIRKGVLCGDENLLLTKQKGSSYNTIGLPIKEKQMYNAEDNKPPINHYDEQWLPIHDYEDTYQISNYGNVYSNVSRKLLKQTINQAGYYQVGLSLKGKIKSAPVHRLVAEHFLYNEENSKRVTHLDGNKLNNKHTNLEWLVPQKVVAYHLETRKEITYKSIKECSEALGISYTSVWKCLNNELSSVGLFTFYYA